MSTTPWRSQGRQAAPPVRCAAARTTSAGVTAATPNLNHIAGVYSGLPLALQEPSWRKAIMRRPFSFHLPFSRSGGTIQKTASAMAEGSRDQIDSAFHGYEPLRIVDDVINSFNDCALRRGSPVSLRPGRQPARPPPCADSCDAADAMQKVLTQAPGMGEHSKAIEEVSLLSRCRTTSSATPPSPASCGSAGS